MYSFTTFSVFFKILAKMGIYYREQSGKGFKAKLKMSKEELVKYLESWVLPNLVQFANLLNQRKPKFINN